MTLTQIAEIIQNENRNIVLIYAFNSTGKTRLSVTYKDITKAANNMVHAGVYYNAYSEDLFIWDNDSDNSEQNIKLDIKFSNLNKLHNSITEADVYKKLVPYKPKYDFFFTPNSNAEIGFDSIVFYTKSNKDIPIKISRGEERVFIWCFFLALFDVESWTKVQDAHFFIDDPVSSLDDHNIFITAATIFDLIESQFEKRKIIITSHHFGLLSILDDWLGRGEKAGKFKSGKTKKYVAYVLESKDDELFFTKPDDGVFLYHLRLIQILDDAYNSNIYTYHFALLRQVLENIASFTGSGRFGYVLELIGITDPDRIAFIVNALSHQKVYYYQTDKPVPDNIDMFREVYERLMTKYNFVIHNH